MPRYKQMPQDPTQIWLIPPSLDEMISKDDVVRVFSEVLDHLDWNIMEREYSERGTPAYPPKVMTKLLVFAYSKGIRSSRKIEELLENDLRFIWLAGGLKPDFHTIARFRKDKKDAFERLFAGSVRLCKELGLLNLNIVAVDGTKIAADASKKSLYDRGRLDKQLEAVRAILREAEAADGLDDETYGNSNGREIPEHLKDAKRREAMLNDLSDKINESGAKIISTSDEDCRMMKTSGKIRPAYNVQAAADSESQVIVAMKVTQCANDVGQLSGMVAAVKENCEMSAVMILADTGYCDEPTLVSLEDAGQEALVSVKEHPKNDNNLFSSQCFIADAERDVLICPAGRELTFSYECNCGSGRYRTYSAHGCASCSFRDQCVKAGRRGSRRVSVSCNERLRHKMKDKVKSPAAKELSKVRSATIEPVFGQTKHDRNFSRFLLRGINGATAEIALSYIAHNALKCLKKADLIVCRAAVGLLCKYRDRGICLDYSNAVYSKLPLAA